MVGRPACVACVLLASSLACTSGSQQTAARAPALPFERPGPDLQAAGDHHDPLLRGITLTDGQRRRIDEISARYRAQTDSMRADDTVERREMIRRMMGVRQRRNDEVRAVLTSEQQAIFDRNVEEMRQRMRDRPEGRMGPRPSPPQS
jgi:Spy/CpxP family protein refolding chaperone